MKGKFISIEGSEGAGKTTVLKFVQGFLSPRYDVVTTREPGGTQISESIREVLLHPASFETILPETELLLMFAARAQHIHHLIKPALNAGKWVLSDRFIDASYAYQGGGRRLKHDWIEYLDKMIVNDIYPDLTLLLDIPVDLGFERAAKRSIEKDRIESEKLDFFEEVRTAYLDRAKKDPHRIKIIDASQPLELVQQQISHMLNQFLRDQQQ
jgi:dTMP kinase